MIKQAYNADFWQKQNGIWNPHVLLYTRCRHSFCARGLLAHLSDTASPSDLAGLECELGKTQNGIWNPDVFLYDALGMFVVRAGSWSTSPARRVRVI